MPEGHISLVGYHLAQQQVGGASALSNVMYILRYFGENFNLLAETESYLCQTHHIVNINASTVHYTGCMSHAHRELCSLS